MNNNAAKGPQASRHGRKRRTASRLPPGAAQLQLHAACCRGPAAGPPPPPPFPALPRVLALLVCTPSHQVALSGAQKKALDPLFLYKSAAKPLFFFLIKNEKVEKCPFFFFFVLADFWPETFLV
ncbi:uncharacterized protein V6R79_021111 [Siganus canaliculatus]